MYITLLLLAFCTNAIAQKVAIFPKGEKAPNVNHVGVVWRSQLSSTDSVFTYGISEVAYEPGARLNWHRHPGGQILLITESTGYYQEKGKPKQTVRKGDIVKCQPGVEHWHGATLQSGVTYIATTPAQKGPTVGYIPSRLRSLVQIRSNQEGNKKTLSNFLWLTTNKI